MEIRNETDTKLHHLIATKRLLHEMQRRTVSSPYHLNGGTQQQSPAGNNGHTSSTYRRSPSYRPNYPLPPNYASNMSSTISPEERRRTARAKRKSVFSYVPWWFSYALIGGLLLFLFVSRQQVGKAKRKLGDFKDRMAREEESDRLHFDAQREHADMKVNAVETKELTRQLEKLEQKLKANRKSEEDFQKQIENIEHEKVSLIQEVKQLKDKSKQEKTGVADEELKKYQNREITLKTRINTLMEKIVKESHRELVDQFSSYTKGSTFFVRFDVNLPDEGNKSFVVETAGLDVMPHSVHLFLEQVKNSLWDGCSFILNAPHLIQAGPHGLNDSVDKMEAFKKMELDTISFQEYNQTYPHLKYTLGYAGRPGGPDFYINKRDNDLHHGPGGQTQQILEEEADPCFGKVVDGVDVVEKIFTLPAGGSTHLLKAPVEIVKAEILDNTYSPPGADGKNAGEFGSAATPEAKISSDGDTMTV